MKLFRLFILGLTIWSTTTITLADSAWRRVSGNPTPQGNIYDLEYANGRWMVVGDGFTGWSDNGFQWHWKDRTDPVFQWWELSIAKGYHSDGSNLMLAYPKAHREADHLAYLSSADGIHWVTHTITLENDTKYNYRLIPNPGADRPWLLLMGRNNKTPHNVYQSIDGKHWDFVKQFNGLIDVQWGEDGLMVLMSGSLVFTKDLQKWQRVSFPDGSEEDVAIDQIGFFDGRWFARGREDGRWFSSYDGVRWNVRRDLIKGTDLLRFTSDANPHGGFRNENLLLVENGPAWLEIHTHQGSSSLFSVDVSHGEDSDQYLAVGLATDQYIFVVNNNADHWVRLTDECCLGPIEERSSNYTSRDDIQINKGEVLYRDGIWMVRTGLKELLVKKDNEVWDCVTCSTLDGQDFTSITHDGTRWVTTTDDKLLVSDDLVDWSQVGPSIFPPTHNYSFRWKTLTYINGEYIALGESRIHGFCDIVEAVAYSSSNLLEWNKRLTVEGATFEQIEFVNNQWVILGFFNGVCEGRPGPSGAIWSSGHLQDWVTTPFSISGQPLISYWWKRPVYQSVGGSDDLWLIATTDREAGGIYQLNDDMSTIRIFEPENTDDRYYEYDRIAQGSGQWVAMGSVRMRGDNEWFDEWFIQSSPNGLDWETRFTSNQVRFNNLNYGDGEWLVTGSDGVFLRSRNAIDWTMETLPTLASINDAIRKQESWVLVGDRGTILVETDNPNEDTGLMIRKEQERLNLIWSGKSPPNGAWIEWSTDLRKWHLWEPFSSIGHTLPKGEFVHKTEIYPFEKKLRFYRISF